MCLVDEPRCACILRNRRGRRKVGALVAGEGPATSGYAAYGAYAGAPLGTLVPRGKLSLV